MTEPYDPHTFTPQVQELIAENDARVPEQRAAIEFPEVVEATREESVHIAAEYLRRALREISEGDYSHADVWIHDALCWMEA